MGGGPGNWSALVCLELGASEGKGSERGGSAQRGSWNARGVRVDGDYPGIWMTFALMGYESKNKPLFPSDEPQFPDLCRRDWTL